MPPRGATRRPGGAASSRVPPPPSPLPDFAARIAAGDDNFSLSELSAAICSSEAETNATAANLDERRTSQLFALLGLALRRSCPISAPGLDNELRAAYCRLRAALVQQLRAILGSIKQLHTDGAGASGELLQSAQRLLDLTVRTHVLRCYAQLLAGAAQQLRRQRSRRNAQAALEALTESMALLRALASTTRWAPDGYAAVALEMTTSNMVEAWAGAYLELASSEACDSQELEKLLNAFSALHPDTYTWRQQRRGKTPHISTPALRCLLSLVAVQLAAMVDGGSLYGLPADAPEARCMFPPEAGNILARVTKLGLGVLSRDDTPPVAVFDLAIRLARGAVMAWLAPPEGPSELLLARVGRVRMSHATCALLAGAALLSAVRCLNLRRKENWSSGSRPADAARLRALWATLVASLEAVMREARAATGGAPAGSGAAQELPDCWVQAVKNVVDVRPDRPFTGLVPAAAGVVAGAMLAAGLVACCERLLRQGFAWPCVIGAQEWLEVLSYGPLPDLTALLVTAAKTLRHLPGAPCGHGRTLLNGSQLDADHFFAWAAGGGWSNGGAKLDPAGRSQQPTQAALLWSLAAAQLLPAAAQLVQRDTVRSLSDVGAFELACARLAEALRWCGVLMAACAAAHERAGCADAAACAAAEAEAAQWRELLLRDVGLMRLMGTAARMLGVLSCGGDLGGTELLSCFSSALGLACCALPQELRAGLLAGEVQVASRCGLTASAAGDDPPVFAPLSCEAVRALLGPGGVAPDPDTLAGVESVMAREQWRPCFAGVRLLAPDAAAAGALLVPPAQVEALLAAHCCANPACCNLSGRSERALRRVACGGGCGLVRYCGEECRAAHWAVGHAGSCKGAAMGQGRRG